MARERRQLTNRAGIYDATFQGGEGRDFFQDFSFWSAAMAANPARKSRRKSLKSDDWNAVIEGKQRREGFFDLFVDESENRVFAKLPQPDEDGRSASLYLCNRSFRRFGIQSGRSRSRSIRRRIDRSVSCHRQRGRRRTRKLELSGERTARVGKTRRSSIIRAFIFMVWRHCRAKRRRRRGWWISPSF